MKTEILVVYGIFYFDLKNNNIAICKTCDKFSRSNNSKTWGMKCIPAHYPVPAGYLI